MIWNKKIGEKDMNIFHLHKDPKICAEYHCDKHVVKMILETAQMLAATQTHPTPVSYTHLTLPTNREV